MDKKTKKKEVKMAKTKPEIASSPSVWAVIPLSGAQYKVETGGVYLINRVKEAVGSAFKLNEIYLLSVDNEVKVGQPLVSGASVDIEVIENIRGGKIDVFKYKAKSRYRRMVGHRQELSKVKVLSINY